MYETKPKIQVLFLPYNYFRTPLPNQRLLVANATKLPGYDCSHLWLLALLLTQYNKHVPYSHIDIEIK